MATTSIVAELPGFLQLFSDGSVKRFSPPVSPPSPDSSAGHKSKDITIDPAKPVTARIFLPCAQDPAQRLPVILYYHGGGFCTGSTKWSGFSHFLDGLCTTAQAIIVSVDYRLAPEHRLPAAYDDCYSSILWLQSNASVEPWLGAADLSRVYLAGESAGGNIVHNVTVRFLQHSVPGIDIRGLAIIHPYLGGEERVQSELAGDAGEWVKISDLCWQLSLPEGANRDHPACNLTNGELLDGDWQRFPAVKVFVAGKDLLKERGLMYAEFLKRRGVEVEEVVAEDQPHAFHFFSPNSQAAHLLQAQIAEFIKQHK